MPQACFTVGNTTAVVGTADSFTSCSKNSTTLQWDFGDGDTNDTASVTTHVFQQPGTFNVKLTAFDSKGQSNTTTQSITAILPDITSANYVGSFAGSQICTNTGNGSSHISISTDGYLGIKITNLYGTGQTFQASVHDLTATISPQVYEVGGNRYVMQGSINLSQSHDTIQLNLITTGFQWRDECSAVLAK